jgi:catechol 2,3-dioxygenase-like lactoylglutathione lyase family enzyme
MIGYVTIGTNDLARAASFYDALLGEMGAKSVARMKARRAPEAKAFMQVIFGISTAIN